MINDKFQPIHLFQRKITTPLFHNAKEAHHTSSDSKKLSSKYLVIDSTKRISEGIFFNAPICPVFIHNKKSYIYLEGECLWNYFLAQKNSDIVLTQQQIWRLMQQLCQSLVVLRNNGIEHRHIKEYAVRRVNAEQFRLVYHPDMNSPLSLIEENKGRWYQFYFAPQQLGDFSKQEVNSCVFSIGAMILNIMNPLDFKRDIYSFDRNEVNAKVIQEKLKNAASGFYSKRLVQIIELALTVDHRVRIGLEELLKMIVKYDPIQRKKKETQNWKLNVSSRLSKSREKRESAKKSEVISRIINFERGTFGGQAYHEQSQTFSEFKETEKEEQEQTKIKQSPQQVNNVLKYNEYYENYKKGENIKVKEIQKSTSMQMYSDIKTSEMEEQDRSMIEMSKMSIFQQNKQNDVIKYEINEFNERICEYHIKLSECLQPVEDIIKQLGFEGVWIDGDIYYGALVNKRRNEIGLQIFPNREYYYGHFKDDLFHGEGFYFWNNSQYFLGIFEAGNKIEGTWQGKAKYVGQIKRNKRHGIGSCYYPTGKIYEGEWFEGKYQGSGIISEPSGQKFIGLFRAGKKWGKGYFLAQNCRVTGIWDEDQAIGSVQIIQENGNVYKGLINSDFEKHGQGLYRFKTGVTCLGIFQNDEFVNGEIRYKNGQKYIGEVRQFRRHGKGKYYYSNGKISQGEWADGTLIS